MSSHPSTESTHSPPAQSERESLAADRARFAVIRAQILVLECSLSPLYEESDLLKDRLDSYTYPVLSLPTEVVSEIFVHFLPVYPETPPMIGRYSPNVLGQICREWRETALSTPALWRAISVPLQQETRLAQKLRLLETSLDRSKSCLLSIKIDCGETQGNLAPFMRALVVHCARWEHLQVYARGHPLPSVEAPMPFLRAIFTTEGRGLSQPALDVAPSAGFHEAPQLRDLTLVFWDARCISRYPWSQLTTFSAHVIPLYDCVDVLNHTVSLVHCFFFVYGPDVDVPPQRYSRAVTLPCLETLALYGKLDTVSWRFMDFFTFPALRKLQIQEDFLHDVSPVDNLVSLVSRSKCELQELWILSSVQRPHHRYDLAFPAVGSIIFAQGAQLDWPFKMTPTEGEEAEPEPEPEPEEEEEEEESGDESD
ncbi:hypothetical protein C8R46DRAFT_1075958 [Mycena filopes]|nr:hypothetical protein C8R46DRAFT_1075958 [Mycena filopes]